MDIRNTLVAQAYQSGRASLAPQTPNAAGSAFARAADAVVGSLTQHEAQARAAMTGTADPHALVEALASSQLAVETVATIRDRVVEAYQEILRMPV
jgi:flagellar hook-basal body complex protein FliE